MFGFSIVKLVFTVLAVAAVWYGWKWLARAQARQRVEHERRMEREAKARSGGAASPTATELTPCPVCGAYVDAASATPCARADCPYPG